MTPTLEEIQALGPVPKDLGGFQNVVTGTILLGDLLLPRALSGEDAMREAEWVYGLVDAKVETYSDTFRFYRRLKVAKQGDTDTATQAKIAEVEPRHGELPETRARTPYDEAVDRLKDFYGLDDAICRCLVDNGINSPAAFEGVEASDLVSMGFTQFISEAIVLRVADNQPKPALTGHIDTPKHVIPQDRATRKAAPMFRGLLGYFPAALFAVANHSYESNEEHNPGQDLQWARDKSADHLDCIIRHTTEGGNAEPGSDDRFYHLKANAWRALAALQEECEARGAKQGISCR